MLLRSFASASSLRLPATLAAAALAALAPLALAACGGTVTAEPACSYNDHGYDPGDTFPSEDGCNTCSCGEDGQVICTKKACAITCTYQGQTYQIGEEFWYGQCTLCICAESGEVVCEDDCVVCDYGEDSYSPGQTFPADDGCNTCYCEENGDVSCTNAACPVCEYAGMTYEPGDTFAATDGCNSCVCGDDGTVACTMQDCPQVYCSDEGYVHFPGDSWQSLNLCLACTCEPNGTSVCSDNGPCSTCYYAGTLHQANETFKSLDDCNTCSCAGDGAVSCTKIECPCVPEKEWWRTYLGDAAFCATIDFDCATGTPFENACGCGCEQPEWCPQYFNCQPPSNCDVDQIPTLCPNSKIVF